MLKTGDIILTRPYTEDGIDMIESVTIVFKDGKAIDEEVERFTLKEFNDVITESRESNKK